MSDRVEKSAPVTALAIPYLDLDLIAFLTDPDFLKNAQASQAAKYLVQAAGLLSKAKNERLTDQQEFFLELVLMLRDPDGAAMLSRWLLGWAHAELHCVACEVRRAYPARRTLEGS